MAQLAAAVAASEAALTAATAQAEAAVACKRELVEKAKVRACAFGVGDGDVQGAPWLCVCVRWGWVKGCGCWCCWRAGQLPVVLLFGACTAGCAVV